MKNKERYSNGKCIAIWLIFFAIVIPIVLIFMWKRHNSMSAGTVPRMKVVSSYSVDDVAQVTVGSIVTVAFDSGHKIDVRVANKDVRTFDGLQRTEISFFGKPTTTDGRKVQRLISTGHKWSLILVDLNGTSTVSDAVLGVRVPINKGGHDDKP